MVGNYLYRQKIPCRCSLTSSTSPIKLPAYVPQYSQSQHYQPTPESEVAIQPLLNRQHGKQDSTVVCASFCGGYTTPSHVIKAAARGAGAGGQAQTPYPRGVTRCPPGGPCTRTAPARCGYRAREAGQTPRTLAVGRPGVGTSRRTSVPRSWAVRPSV